MSESATPALKNEFVEEVLDCISRLHKIKIISFSLVDRGGEHNFHSVVVEGRKGALSCKLYLLLKCLPSNVPVKDVIRTVAFFRNEAAFYNHVAPVFLDFQQVRRVRTQFQGFPNCYLARADGKNDVIVIEDLRAEEYCAIDKKQGLDYAHCVLTMEELGKFHAFSIAMKDQDPNLFNALCHSIRETTFSPEFRSWLHPLLRNASQNALEVLKEEKVADKYIEKLEMFCEDFLERMIQMVRDPERTHVICHGDLWTNNILFRSYEAEKPQQVRFVNFDACRCCSPVVDLTYLLYSCVSREVREAHLDKLLRVYHHSLADFLDQLGSNPGIYSYQNLEDDWRELSLYGLGTALLNIPIIYANPESSNKHPIMKVDETVSMEKLGKAKPIVGQLSRQKIIDIVEEFVGNGFL